MEDKPMDAKGEGTSATPPKQALPATVAAPVSKAGYSPVWLWLLLLLVIAGAGVSVFLWWQGLAVEQRAAVDIAALSARVDQQAEAHRELQGALAAQSSNSDQQQVQMATTIAELQRRLDHQRNLLLRLSTTDRTDWLLAEVEYLMRLANQRVLMSKDVNGAAKLLIAADKILRNLDDQALFSVRSDVSREISALKAAGSVDVEGLYLRLQAAAEQAAQLKLFDAPTQLPESSTPAATDQGWNDRLQSGLAKAWSKLKGYVRIRRRDDIFQPLIAPEYEQLLRQSLQLQFDQAQVALLSGNSLLYRSSLQKSRNWIERYYPLDEHNGAPILAEIKSLEGQSIEVQTPDISTSLRDLKEYVNTVHRLKPATQKVEPTPKPEEPTSEAAAESAP